MLNDTAAAKADSVLESERARWPRWRNAALKPAPAWFRGQELDLLDAKERRVLHGEVQRAIPGVNWAQGAVMLCVLPVLLRSQHAEQWPWLWAAIGVGYAALVLGVGAMRRRNVLTTARRQVRESADWPQRVERRNA